MNCIFMAVSVFLNNIILLTALLEMVLHNINHRGEDFIII